MQIEDIKFGQNYYIKLDGTDFLSLVQVVKIINNQLVFKFIGKRGLSEIYNVCRIGCIFCEASELDDV